MQINGQQLSNNPNSQLHVQAAPFECCLLCALVLPFSPVFHFFYTIRIFISFCCSRFFARFSSAVCARKITQLVNCTNNMSALLQRSFKQARECATNLRAGKRHESRGSPLGVWFDWLWSGLVWFGLVGSSLVACVPSLLKCP